MSRSNIASLVTHITCMDDTQNPSTPRPDEKKEGENSTPPEGTN